MLKRQLLIRVATPNALAHNVTFHDLKVRFDAKMRNFATFNVLELAKLADLNGDVCIEPSSLSKMLINSDPFYDYTKIPCPEKRYDSDFPWEIQPPKMGEPTDPLGQRGLIKYMGKAVAALNDETGEIVPVGGK